MFRAGRLLTQNRFINDLQVRIQKPITGLSRVFYLGFIQLESFRIVRRQK